ncbi:MAG: hypothetical protein VW418_02010 [Gammaproteobacteria bacterium]
MKIEIGESLISSYLYHVEGCRIVQTNWKKSSNWEEGEFLKKESELLFNKVVSDPNFMDLFKQKSFDSFIKQAEIDVLGLNTIEQQIYAYDIAFHENGLNYSGEKKNNLQSVITKVFRAICMARLYFEDYQINSFFVTPKCGSKTKVEIEDKLKILSNVIDDSDIHLGLICNDDFYNSIYDPTVKALKNENNTNELFGRALKLINLDKRNSNLKTTSNKQLNKKVTSGGMKIGQYVKELFYELNKTNKLSEIEIVNLQDPDYCKRIFNAGFPVLIKNSRSKEDHLGRVRYYKDEYIKGYWLSSQWYDPQKENLKKWEKKMRTENS